ncbi:unnamed protein product [Ectocarpus sp. 6 AP-2014]
MAATAGIRVRQHAGRDDLDGEVTLPCILDCLSRLEHDSCSYHELLDDFASRRRVGPVKKELPAKHVLDPAEEADEIVQAYLSVNHGACSSRAFGHSGARAPLALSGSAAVGRLGKRPYPNTKRARNIGTSRAKQEELEHKLDRLKTVEKSRANGDGKKLQTAQNDGSPHTSGGRTVLFEEGTGFQRGGEGSIGFVRGGSKTNQTPETRPSQSYDSLGRHVEALTTAVLASSSTLHDHSDGQRSGSRSRLRCSTKCPCEHDSFDYYPSRPISAGAAVVSLISPRTSKRIRRLPRPEESELENLQRVEQAARNFSAQKLDRKKPGGLYSTIGRRQVGLVETDIDDLTATITSRTEVLAAAKSTAVAKSLTEHNNGVLAGLLRPDKTTTLPTISPSCFHDPLDSSSPITGSPKRSPFTRSTTKIRRSNGRGPSEPAATATTAGASAEESEEGLEMSERMKVIGVDESQHREDLADNLRRLRTILGEPEDKVEARRSGSPSILSVRELRAIGAAQRQRLQHSTNMEGADALAVGRGTQQGSTDEGVQQERAADELGAKGNVLLRDLAKTLFSSMQFRAQKEFLLLAFRKWKTVSGESVLAGYLGATVRIQCSLRRTLAITEAAERRRLRDNQDRHAKRVVERVVQRRQNQALTLQRWIRGESGRRRAQRRRCLLQATRRVQRAVRQKNARARARRWRKEQRRVREAEDEEEQREREFREKLRAEVAAKVEAQARREALFEERCGNLQERFRREGAVTRIQAVWRLRVLKRNLSALVRIGKRTRAIRIQRAARVYLAKKELHKRKEAFLIRHADEIASAIKIQSIVRRKIAWNRVDERRFQRSKEQLVSTMDAERALRNRTIKVPRIKAVAAREGAVLSAQGKGKPYIIDPVALKILLADKRRAINPWQESTDRKAATKIQALFRSHRQVVRIRRMRVQRRRQDAEARREAQYRAANNLQRVFRGRRARVEAKSRRYGLRAVRVQKVWRGFLGKRAAADRRQRVQAATVLQRRLRGAQARSLAARMRREAVTTSAPAIAIQATARRYLARRRRNKLVKAKQIEWEMTTMAKEMSRFCVERARLRVIVEGAAAPTCRGDGVTQFIFRKIAVKRSGEEGSGSFRLEGRAFNKLFASTPGVFSSSFLATDVDLVFARVKDKDEKTLTYAQFAAALNVVAATLFPKTKRFRDFLAFKAKAARLLELVEGKVLKAPGATEYRKFCQKAGERFVFRSANKIQATIRGYLGRKRFRQKQLESDKVARTALESLEVVKLQASGHKDKHRNSLAFYAG